MKKTFLFQILCFFVSSLTIPFFALTSDNNIFQKIISVIIAIIFWAALISGIVLGIVAGRKHDVSGLPGIIRIVKEPVPIASSIVFLILLIVTVVFSIIKPVSTAGYFLIASTLFMFEIRSILNGKNYIYIKNSFKEENENEKEQNS